MNTRLFQNNLLSWFKSNARSLPWRTEYTPYQVWISEIMLQQTQMERGVEYYKRWMQHLPNIRSVAEASEDELLRLWEGLGYYSRCINLHRCAQIILENYDGKIPDNKKALLALPGIGQYTAAAILSIAYEQDEPLVDANVARIFSRVFNIETPVTDTKTKARLTQLAAELLPSGHARIYNQALMELGALVCRKVPLCNDCPLRFSCIAAEQGLVSMRPVLPEKVQRIHLSMATGILVCKKKIFIVQRSKDSLWGGLWEFPGGKIQKNETPEQTIIREYKEQTGFSVIPADYIGIVKHSYTRFSVDLHCFYLTTDTILQDPVLSEAVDWKWIDSSELAQYAFSAGHRKLINKIAGSQLTLDF